MVYIARGANSLIHIDVVHVNTDPDKGVSSYVLIPFSHRSRVDLVFVDAVTIRLVRSSIRVDPVPVCYIICNLLKRRIK